MGIQEEVNEAVARRMPLLAGKVRVRENEVFDSVEVAVPVMSTGVSWDRLAVVPVPGGYGISGDRLAFSVDRMITQLQDVIIQSTGLQERINDEYQRGRDRGRYEGYQDGYYAGVWAPRGERERRWLYEKTLREKIDAMADAAIARIEAMYR